MAKKEEIKATIENAEPVIYIGPSIPNRIAKHALYRGETPQYIKKLKAEIKGLEHLFVKVSSLKDANEKLNDKTSYLSVIYAQVANQKGVK